MCYTSCSQLTFVCVTTEQTLECKSLFPYVSSQHLAQCPAHGRCLLSEQLNREQSECQATRRGLSGARSTLVPAAGSGVTGAYSLG